MTSYLETEGGRLAYDLHEAQPAAPGAPLVILAPGIGDVRAEYRFLAPLLARAGRRVATVDLRGHGESSTGWGEYTPEAVGRDLLALGAHLGAGRVILGGCSMAAASAVWAAVEAPARVAGVLMFGPSLEDGPPSQMMNLVMGLMFGGPWRVRAWDLFFATRFAAEKPADLESYRANLRANLAQPGRFESVKGFLYASKDGCARRMDQVQAPVLLVMGSRDPDYKQPAAQAQEWAARLRGQASIVEEAGHYPHVDHPDVVAGRIIEWIGAALPAAASTSAGGGDVEVPAES